MINKEREENNIRFLLEKKYNRVKFEISNLEMKKNILKDSAYDTSITPSYSGMPTGGGGTSDKVFDKVAKIDADLEKIDNSIASKKSFITLIDNLVANLNPKQQAVVKAKAFQHKDYNTIAKELRANGIEIYNTHYCYELYAQSCKNMQDLLDATDNDFKQL